jgi:phosphoglycolate phosphatase
MHMSAHRPLPPLRAALIDLDGTLIDTLGDFDVALNRVLDELALPPISRSAIERIVGKGSEHLVRSTLAEVGGSPAQFDAAWDGYQRHYMAINGDHSRGYAGVEEGLKALRRAGLRLACLTNKPTNFAMPLLAKKGLAGYFDVVFGGDAFERKKPDPMPLVKTCEALGVAPAQALMVGDSSNDARAARAAGCAIVLVTYGYNHGEPVRGVDADGYVDSILDAAALLRAA